MCFSLFFVFLLICVLLFLFFRKKKIKKKKKTSSNNKQTNKQTKKTFVAKQQQEKNISFSFVFLSVCVYRYLQLFNKTSSQMSLMFLNFKFKFCSQQKKKCAISSEKKKTCPQFQNLPKILRGSIMYH
jgi:uncharacterized ion transporter superfamily protein YfcC